MLSENAISADLLQPKIVKRKRKTPTEKQVDAMLFMSDKELIPKALESLHALNRRAKKIRDNGNEYRGSKFFKYYRYRLDHIYELKTSFLDALVIAGHAKVSKFTHERMTGYYFECDVCETSFFSGSQHAECRYCYGILDGEESRKIETWYIISCLGYRFHQPENTATEAIIENAVAEINSHDPDQPQREIPKVGLTIEAQHAYVLEAIKRLKKA